MIWRITYLSCRGTARISLPGELLPLSLEVPCARGFSSQFYQSTLTGSGARPLSPLIFLPCTCASHVCQLSKTSLCQLCACSFGREKVLGALVCLLQKQSWGEPRGREKPWGSTGLGTALHYVNPLRHQCPGGGRGPVSPQLCPSPHPHRLLHPCLPLSPELRASFLRLTFRGKSRAISETS